MKKNTFEEFKTYLYGKIFPNQSKQVKAVDVRDAIETLAYSVWKTVFTNEFENSNIKALARTVCDENRFETLIDLTIKNGVSFSIDEFEIIPQSFCDKIYLKADSIYFVLKSRSGYTPTGSFVFNNLFGMNDGEEDSLINPNLWVVGSYAIAEGTHDTMGPNNPGIPNADTVSLDISEIPLVSGNVGGSYSSSTTLKNISIENLNVSYSNNSDFSGNIIVIIKGTIL